MDLGYFVRGRNGSATLEMLPNVSVKVISSIYFAGPLHLINT